MQKKVLGNGEKEEKGGGETKTKTTKKKIYVVACVAQPGLCGRIDGFFSSLRFLHQKCVPAPWCCCCRC